MYRVALWLWRSEDQEKRGIRRERENESNALFIFSLSCYQELTVARLNEEIIQIIKVKREKNK